jgi:hypothetical protein
MFRGFLKTRDAHPPSKGAIRTGGTNAHVWCALVSVERPQWISIHAQPITMLRAVAVAQHPLWTPRNEAELWVPSKNRLGKPPLLQQASASAAITAWSGDARAIGMGARLRRFRRDAERMSVEQIAPLVRFAVSPPVVDVCTAGDRALREPPPRRDEVYVSVSLVSFLAANAKPLHLLVVAIAAFVSTTCGRGANRFGIIVQRILRKRP